MRGAQSDQESQLRELEKIEQRIAAGGLLDTTKDDLSIDAFARDFGRSKRDFRSDIEKIGRSAVSVSAILLRILPAERALALQMLATIQRVDQVAKPLRNKKVSDFAPAFVTPVPQSGTRLITAHQVWTKIFELAIELHQQRQLVERFELAKPLPGRSGMLARAFVMQMREYYENKTGRRASKVRTGKLVQLMQWAWADLQFPDIPEGRLGHILETLPR